MVVCMADEQKPKKAQADDRLTEVFSGARGQIVCAVIVLLIVVAFVFPGLFSWI